MKRVHRKIILSLCIVAAVVAFFSGCAMYDPGVFGEIVINGQAIPIKTQQDTVTLAWDPPSGPVETYRIYYREHGVLMWEMLDEIAATPSPEYVLNIAQFGEGSFDFGVSAVDSSDQESAIHTSLDITADPTTGWYLIWAH